MRIRSTTWAGGALVAALLIASATAAAAQERPRGQPMHHMHQEMQEMRGQPMMMTMMEGPRMALRERERLGLSEAQVRELESVRDRMRQAHREPMQRMRNAHRELAEAMNDELDDAAARAALERVAELRTEMGMAMLRARQETRAILTEEQREQLSELRQQHMQEHMQRMRGMRGMMMGEEGGMRRMMDQGAMMMLCPMMQMQDGAREDSEPDAHEHEH